MSGTSQSKGSFTEKQLGFSFQLQKTQAGRPAAFDAAGAYNTLSITGARAEVEIRGSVGLAGTSCHARIYGLSPSNLAALTDVVQANVLARNDIVTITAAYGGNMAVVFKGNIQESWQSMDQPDSMLEVTALDLGAAANLLVIPPTSVGGSGDVATMLSGLAQSAGLTLENSANVSVQIATPYLWGSAGQQIRQLCDAANVAHAVEGTSLVIWPYGSKRNGQVEVSPATGLVGYPHVTQSGLALTCLFNPNIKIGQPVHVTSSLQRATGLWIVDGLVHDLTSQVPNGPWFTAAQAHSNTLVNPS